MVKRETTPRVTRAYVLMEGLGCLYEDLFDDEAAVRIGAFAARISLPIEDVVVLVQQLSLLEDAISTMLLETQEEHGMEPDSPNQSHTSVALRRWAEASNFPLAWSPADAHVLFRAMATWDVELKRAVGPLVLSWLREIVAPLSLALGHVPILEVLEALLDAMRGWW